MKRITLLLIILLAAIIFATLGWYLFVRDQEVPLGEAIRDVLPFGSGDDIDPSQILRDSSPDTGAADDLPFDQFGSPAADLFRISDTPVAGAIVFKRTNPNQIVARYAERATGHIYDAILPANASSTRLEKTRITNNTLPKIYEAYFRTDGSAVLFRSLKDDTDVVENMSLALTPSSARATSSEFFSISSTSLRGEIGAVAVGAGNNLFYSLRDTSSVIASAFNGAGQKTLLASAFTDWRLASAGNSLIAHTKASASAPGIAYTLNTSSGALNKILGPLNGLVAIPNTSGNRALYSYSDSGRSRLFVKNLQNNEVSEISPVTLAEKCVWSVRDVDTVFCAAPIDGLVTGEPDTWYRGITHYSDRLWLFNTTDNIVEVLAEPKSTLGIDIDATELKLSPDEDYLIFINKNDLSLWALRLN